MLAKDIEELKESLKGLNAVRKDSSGWNERVEKIIELAGRVGSVSSVNSAKYELYSGEGEFHPVLVAIAEGEVGTLDSMSGDVVRPEDFFLPTFKDVHRIGEIKISGDIELLPHFFAFSV